MAAKLAAEKRGEVYVPKVEEKKVQVKELVKEVKAKSEVADLADLVNSTLSKDKKVKKEEEKVKKEKVVKEKKNATKPEIAESPAASDIKEVISAISKRLQFVSSNFATSLSGDESLKAQFDKLHAKF